MGSRQLSRAQISAVLVGAWRGLARTIHVGVRLSVSCGKWGKGIHCVGVRGFDGRF